MSLPPPRTRQQATEQTHKLLRRMMLGLRARMDEELKPSHCTLAQLRVLYELQQNPGASGASVARACEMTPQSAQAMLARVVRLGWAARGKDAGNGRVVTAKLTRSGEHLLAHARATKARIEAEIWAGVPLADLRDLNAILGRGLANLEP